MNRHLSIKTRILLWFALFMLLVVSLTMVLTYAIGDTVFRSDITTQLVNLVNANVQEIEYLNSLSEGEMEAGDQFLAYQDGYLEIDDDFCDYLGGVYTCLVDSGNKLLYGECPVRLSAGKAFTYTTVTTIRYRDERYYIYERPLQGAHLQGLWLRGVASHREGTTLLQSMVRFTVIVLPLIAILAILGGRILINRALAPVNELMEATSHIGDEQDLSYRIHIGKDDAGKDGKAGEADDELHQLADTMNGMLDRLETSFAREKRFTADVSHELRTPLSVIMAQCEVGLELSESEEDYREALTTIQAQGARMQTMISQLLFFSRLEQGQQALQLEETDLSRLTADICAEQRTVHEGQDITLLQDIQPGIETAVDRGLYGRMLGNLIDNGYKYGNPAGHITVSLAWEADAGGAAAAGALPYAAAAAGKPDDDAAGRMDEPAETEIEAETAAAPAGAVKRKPAGILLTVSDDGIGIAAEDLPHIWDRFYQVDPSRNHSDGNGAGLGLPLVREIAQLHGGRIEVASAPGTGTTFTVHL